MARRLAGPLSCVLLLFYLGFHTLTGERGVFALMQSTQQLEELNERLSEARAQRQVLENKVALLSNHSLDLDMLDERARVVLGYTGKDERVVFLNEGR
ncbi:MAG: septum formation initiator family protein [Alphaproteobacteria bacterium]